MVDINQLEKGTPYEELKKSFIIFICLEDFSNRNLPVYTFTNRCAQNLGLELDDGATRIIINASGNRTGLSEDMSAFLDFLMDGKERSEFTGRLKKDVEDAIMNREWGIEYMSINAKMMDERSAGRKEGREEGREEFRTADFAPSLPGRSGSAKIVQIFEIRHTGIYKMIKITHHL